MTWDIFTLGFAVLWLIVYGSACIISLIFTFSLDKYRDIEEKINFNFLPNTSVTPLDVNINILDAWLAEHNRIVGPILVLLSVLDLKFLITAIAYL